MDNSHREECILRVREALAEPIRRLAAKFPSAFAEGLPKSADCMVLFVEDGTSSIRSMLIFEASSQKLVRRDVWDLNVSDVLIDLAGERREDLVEQHDFVYENIREAVSAYLDWLQRLEQRLATRPPRT